MSKTHFQSMNVTMPMKVKQCPLFTLVTKCYVAMATAGTVPKQLISTAALGRNKLSLNFYYLCTRKTDGITFKININGYRSFYIQIPYWRLSAENVT